MLSPKHNSSLTLRKCLNPWLSLIFFRNINVKCCDLSTQLHILRNHFRGGVVQGEDDLDYLGGVGGPVNNIICARSLTKKFSEGVCFFGYQYRFLKSTLCLPSITTTLELMSWQNLLSKPNMTQLKPTQKQLRWVDIVARELKFGTDTHLINLIKERVQSEIKISQI